MSEPRGAPPASPADVAARARREAESYREFWAPVLLEPARRLVHELAGPGVREVLDVGAGVGSSFPDLATTFPGARVTETDRAREMIALAPATAARAVMDAAHLAAKSGAIDRVVMSFMLFHLPEPLAGLREARRVLAPGGAVGLLTWAAEMTSPAMRAWVECLDEFGKPALKKTNHAGVGSPAILEAMLAEAGFAAIRAWTEEITAQFSAERLIRMRTELAASRPRFDALAPGVQTEFLAEIRQRLARLAPEDFLGRATVVFAIGRVEG